MQYFKNKINVKNLSWTTYQKFIKQWNTKTYWSLRQREKNSPSRCYVNCLFKILIFLPWMHWSVVPYTNKSGVHFPVRAHAWTMGPIPGWGICGRHPIDVSHVEVSLSLSLSLSLCLCFPSPFFPFSKINEYVLGWGLTFWYFAHCGFFALKYMASTIYGIPEYSLFGYLFKAHYQK